MPSQFIYNIVRKYHINAKSIGPLRIGSSSGDTEDVFMDPFEEKPMIQASGIAGAFRSYYKQIGYDDKELFGSPNTDIANGHIRFTDGILTNVNLEIRPRVKINSETGSVASATANGSRTSRFGQKFNMALIGADATLQFDLYVYLKNEDEKIIHPIEEMISGLDHGELRLGGQKSNGCGEFEIEKVQVRSFDLRKEEDRNAWIEEEPLAKVLRGYDDITESIHTLKSRHFVKYVVTMNAEVKDTLLVKSISPIWHQDANFKNIDAENIYNVNGIPIIPGSSVKGSLRNQMERIASYLATQYGASKQELIDQIFGTSSVDGVAGNIRFSDVVIQNNKEKLSVHNHIDKFTGSTINRALFSDVSVAGDLVFKIEILKRGISDIERRNTEATLGLLLLALRDTAIGEVTFGSGFANGKGHIEVSKIKIEDMENEGRAEIDFNTNQQTNTTMINHALQALKRSYSYDEL